MKRLLLPITIILSLIFSGISIAQNNDTITLSLEQGYEMKIDGSANVRDWDAEVTRINATVEMKKFDTSDLSSLTADHFKKLELRIPVEDIDSDSRRLTRNLQDYLKIDDHPTITFKLNGVESVELNGNTAKIKAKGVVNAAGQDKTVEMNVNAKVNGNKVTFEGVQDLKMTDFGIDPPTAVMGTVRARDEIQIIYSLTFSIN